ncbi:MAG: hypothetical protein N0C84_01010 [Candidatus Thiodiazotropha taylori]|uniref:Uncharacterized protein n=1 Tax=Candidatus Thiodiazotropha taylori TaxID=2792791 RepID=A0A9E4N366_9GAMM|nr:hypothetical protein [Candidatus Thiodiazotropha taylori]MCW4255025.1 hypothetical protein [Candidatus Thiodiazotropha taylori]
MSKVKGFFDDNETFTVYNGKKYPSFHGSPFDRGAASSYYGRRYCPHWWPEGTGDGERVEREQMTKEEIQAYTAGYEYNEETGMKKDW